MRKLLLSAVPAGLTLLVLVACSDSASSPAPTSPAADGGEPPTAEGGPVDSSTEGHDADASGAAVHESATVVAYGTATGVAGVTAAVGASGTTTDADGRYSLEVPSNDFYEVTLTAPGYYKVIQQDWKVATDVDRGKQNIVAEPVAAVLVKALEAVGGVPRDVDLGLVALRVFKVAPCQTTGGATVTITPSGATTRYVYFDDAGKPSANASTSASPLPAHVVVYNVPVGQVTMAITSPTCSEEPWPFTGTVDAYAGAFTDRGHARVEGGNALSFLRAYLGAKL